MLKGPHRKVGLWFGGTGCSPKFDGPPALASDHHDKAPLAWQSRGGADHYFGRLVRTDLVK